MIILVWGHFIGAMSVAEKLHKTFNRAASPYFWIAGMKIISDAVVDGCTAALSHPYLNTGRTVQPIWTAEALQPAPR